MVYTGKETLKEALTRQDIFNGYDALNASIDTLSKSGYGAKAPTLLDSPLMGYSDADIHKEIPAKSELCCAVFIERLKDSGFRGKYPTSMRLAEERIESEIRAISENTSPEYKKELDDCRKYLSGRQAVLEGYLDYVINELYEGATDEYLEEIDPEVFRVEKGASLSETMSALESAMDELLAGAEDFYTKELPGHMGMTGEDARHFGLPVEEAVRKEDKEIRAKALPQSDVTDNGKRELWINCGESILYFMTQKDTIKEAMKEFLDRLDSIGVNHDNFGWSALELRAGNTDPDNYYRVIESCGPGYPGRWEKEKTAKQKSGNTR